MSRRPIRERKPLPGNEVEAEMVTHAALAKLQEIEDTYTGREWIMDLLTSPHHPGLFSGPLYGGLERMAQQAINATGLLRRLAALCGEETGAAGAEIGVASGEAWVRDSLNGLTDEEAEEVRSAASVARYRALEARKANAGLPTGCPKCGGSTYGCKLDGEYRWMGRAKPAPARRCYKCDTVTPNPAAPTAKVLRLVSLEMQQEPPRAG